MQMLYASYVLAVPDLEAAARYWGEVLGFEPEAEQPDGWRFLMRDRCRVMLGECPDAPPVAAIGDHGYFGYVLVDDVDAYHAEISARGALIRSPPMDKPWGLREMAVGTPHGHRLAFGQQIA